MQTNGNQAFVNPRDTRLAHADLIGEESRCGKLISAGPILERLDSLGLLLLKMWRAKIAHGDLVRLEGEVVSTRSSSLAIQITGTATMLKWESLSYTECHYDVALDENMQASPGLPKLMDLSDSDYVKKHQEIAKQRKELAARWRGVQEAVDSIAARIGRHAQDL
ncbi:unnamed protein product [Peronospora destructor]|uniref:CST complex subunit Stn1 N-terminal domain-containing protein n=1 Tax=Peronospora destructor TaxID=86335 RepID=A0AAV0T2X4_9STRA|nr:unnamed protein product [Peronospora destructor]